ncbi:Prepilin type IV endopeptidase, peptidase domain containing protein [uncultured Caudovirales phage]|uniref:Prepilin type IV endopeptidase, peptidase domain containing protein n=1 Tax=uncultured Caudovirales phage TaxID=2100421 RepID=A0A6J5L5T3_9CAUD|nr:Prepilin type IV endopeptidase, peptidase domain containing protein [uncultured Caudovirales phage]CAB5219414.1 Prepilin type IV endopeptidase, peptidase domain containing protein [uncultured Caudovirales phage]
MLEIVFQVLPVLYLLLASVPLIVIDIREHRLPNKIVLPSIPLTFFSWLVLAIADGLWVKFVVALSCAILAFAIGFTLNRFGLLGMGDAKLAFALVFVLAWFAWALALALPLLVFGLGALTVLWLYFTNRIRLNSSIPLGPHLIVSFAILLGIAL